MRVGLWLAALALPVVGLVPSVARAEWLQASSAHFVVYADDSQRDIRTFSQQLERYHSAMAYLTGGQDLPPPSPSNRVTVFVVKNVAEVRRLHGGDNRFIGGFYRPRAGGSLAIVPRVATGTTNLQFSMISLLHEYAHHFMISTSGFPMPRWYSEGGAEFFASAGFPSDGAVEIGKPAMHRAAELLLPGFARDVKVSELLDPPKARPQDRARYDAFYGKSWLLFHYLTFNDARDGQLGRYLKGMEQGQSSRDAALAAFGDFEKLERDLDGYLHTRMMGFKIPAKMLTTGEIAVRPLSPGEAAMMAIRVRSSRGVTADEAKVLLPEARAVAARFPEDPAVLTALAEAEHDAGNDREAIAAADAALAKDPAQTNAHVQKGLSLFRQAADAADRPAAYARARVAFATLNRRENDHPLPLIYYYRSYVEQGLPPNDLAIQGLARAVQMAPFDLGLRMTLGVALLQRHDVVQAKRAIGPVAYNPHGGGLAASAQRVLARIEADPKWDARDVNAVAAGAEDDAE